ncbi:MAG: arylsulfatase A, partial [Pirellulaceae bacterium]
NVDPEFRTTANFRYAFPARVVTSEARVRDYRAAVTCMDASIGKFLAVLEQKKILDNTIVIFMSDNGGGGGSDNAPLRGHKSQMWEGGIRVPCIVRWPNGNIPANKVSDEFLTSLELFPSLVRATKAESPKDLVLDGFDWWPVLRGEIKSPRTEMFWKRKDLIGARVGKWKWVVMGSQSGLYDLQADIGEQRDLSAELPDVLKMVQARYANWLKEMEAAEPRGPFRDY